MPCCKYCRLQNPKEDSSYVTQNDLLRERLSLRREMGQMKVSEIAMIELIEELQQRVQELMKIVDDQHDRITELQSYVTYSTYDRANLVSPGVIVKLTKTYTDRLTPYELYRRYLIGDYDADPPPENRGYQEDNDIKNRVDVLPKEIMSPKDYIPQPDEKDRLEDRIAVRDMFVALGSAFGTLDEEEYKELNDMLNGEYHDALYQKLKNMYIQGSQDEDAASVLPDGE